MEGGNSLALGVLGFSKQSASVTHLAADGQYSQLINTLQQLDGVSETAVSPLLSLAVQLCHLCQQNEQLIVNQRQSLGQLEQQQQMQQQQLMTLLTMVGGGKTAVVPVAPPPPPPPVPPIADLSQPHLVVYTLGDFSIYQDDQPISDWPSGKGKAILKYLLLHRQRPVAKEVLMDTFWPEADGDAARNNLNVAIYNLRRSLRSRHSRFSHILYRDDAYMLNPELRIWCDAEAFSRHYGEARRLEGNGRLPEAMVAYQAAEALYQGPFLAEDRYESWLDPHRQRLEEEYLHTLKRLSHSYYQQEAFAACITVCRKLLLQDSFDEETHRCLMACYYQQGNRNLALRQYHTCVAALQELEVEPEAATTELYDTIRQNRPT